MTIPLFQTLMLPVLKASAAGEVKIGAVAKQMADIFELTPDERAQLLPSGKQTIIANRTHWAKSYLDHANLVQKTKHGYFVITDRGKQVLASNPDKIDVEFLSQFSEFNKFKAGGGVALAASEPASVTAVGTPDEVLRSTVKQLADELRTELLDRLRSAAPSFFESAVVELLVAMGYGGAQENPGKAIGKPGDGGLDGVIDEDALGLDRVYIQAKRYKPDSKIGSADVQSFYGAVAAAKASKGVFVTTSDFSSSALQFADKVPVKLVLINGERLTQLMFHYNVGVRVQETLHVKKLDEDFFAEE